MFGRKNSAQLANLTYKRYFINTTIGFSSFWNFGTINLNPFCHCKVLLIKWECTKMESDESATPFLHTHKVTNAWMQAQHCWLTLHLHAETSITDKDPKTKKTTTTMTSSLRQQQCEKRVNACAMNVDISAGKKKGFTEGGRWAVGDGWGGVASRQPAQTTQTTAHTFLICHHGKWPSEMPLPPREKLLYWPESAVWCCMRFSFLHFSYVSLLVL